MALKSACIAVALMFCTSSAHAQLLPIGNALPVLLDTVGAVANPLLQPVLGDIVGPLLTDVIPQLLPPVSALLGGLLADPLNLVDGLLILPRGLDLPPLPGLE